MADALIWSCGRIPHKHKECHNWLKFIVPTPLNCFNNLKSSPWRIFPFDLGIPFVLVLERRTFLIVAWIDDALSITFCPWLQNWKRGSLQFPTNLLVLSSRFCLSSITSNRKIFVSSQSSCFFEQKTCTNFSRSLISFQIEDKEEVPLQSKPKNMQKLIESSTLTM